MSTDMSLRVKELWEERVRRSLKLSKLERDEVNIDH
jgi:hypothetical protein